VMGQRDLARMRTGEMDERGKGSTQGGWICGIIGTILGVLGLILFVFVIIFFGFALFGAMSAKPTNPPGAQPGLMRKFSVEPGRLKVWQYIPSRGIKTSPHSLDPAE
jgi:hypothetical protein